ncbi:hypothetical protein OYT13_11405 [Pandoraea sp. XJJ-1]|uniref:hypothetical protein n=1 Tax=Pandoraea sp. XJJ-1 TaxID=3002643 RepID=UPI00228264F5|nr:hypothetical protein [Pandoraea sp. XJJ-1]WAL84954.1 hypothetical protein OYT13_11405 [Pandoraea sp. XJJ-1]
MALSDDLKFKLIVAGVAVAAVLYVGKKAATAGSALASTAFNAAVDTTRAAGQTVLGPVYSADDWVTQHLPAAIATPDALANTIDQFVFNVAPQAIANGANSYGAAGGQTVTDLAPNLNVSPYWGL